MAILDCYEMSRVEKLKILRAVKIVFEKRLVYYLFRNIHHSKSMLLQKTGAKA